MKTKDYIKIDSYKSRSVLELQEAINKAVEKLDKEHPEWRDSESDWVSEDEEESTLILYFYREMTEEEIKKYYWKLEEDKKREKGTLARLMRKYPEEVENILKTR